MQQSACLFFLLKEAKAAPEKQDRNDLPGKDEHHDYYFKETGRRITFEYSLVAGVNDSDEDARELSGRIRDMNCHVNLIPVNPIKERSFVRSTRQAVENFKIKLEKCGINVTIRREMGSDIDGACGQLRKSYMEKTESEK